MKVQPYLTFDGNCEDALKFYAEVSGGALQIIPYRGSPAAEGVSPDKLDRVMHGNVQFGDTLIMASDAMEPNPPKPCGFTLSISLPDTTKGAALFNALAEGGQIKMPFEPTFWALGFGMLVDKFGVGWMVNCEAEQS